MLFSIEFETQELYLLKTAVIQAIESGFRQIDTAAAYKNEDQIGDAILDVTSRGIVTREELWITTKLNLDVGNREGVLPALQESLKKLKLDYVDLYLVHSPENLALIPEYDYLSVWKGMEDVKKLNLTRSIGVSNFNSTDINRILANSEIVPSVNEIEVNPTYTNSEIIAYCQSLNITVLSYAPFGFMVPRPIESNITSTFEDPVLVRIAQKYGKTSSQVVLRYLIDLNTIPIPRSINTQRIQSNIDLFDFRLTQEEISSINELNRDVKVYNFDQESLAIFFDYFGL
ncbi:aldo-keto reductase AKR2E4-like [Vanessa atalanta]|uniref:aldo-keto reductase AKR2E4-like n=1 Tax=Vanessa atalanta TaxID=42275 RepID=UPI001FCCE6D9|nr:aldo-keto reductase AKR2E4-like [Vanessa atalanta]